MSTRTSRTFSLSGDRRQPWLRYVHSRCEGQLDLHADDSQRDSGPRWPSLTDSFTAVSRDGTASQIVTVTIHGANEADLIARNNQISTNIEPTLTASIAEPNIARHALSIIDFTTLPQTRPT